MSFTPRRSARSEIFTPVPQSPAAQATAAATTFHWLSNASYPDGPDKPHYSSYKRLVNKAALVKRRRTNNAKSGLEESRFSIGDGVLVNVDGGNDGVGILLRLWEEDDADSDDEEESDDSEDDSDDESSEEGNKKLMMAEIHWCFRQQDLPGVMKNLNVAENEVLLAASPIRRVSTSLPISLLVRTVPIYSRRFFRKQFRPTLPIAGGTGGKASSSTRAGVYWCDRAFDKGAKGGKIWRVDVDAWREGGKAGEGWVVPVVAATEDAPSESEKDGSDSSGAESEEEEADVPDDEEDEDEGDDGDETEEGDVQDKGRKRKRGVKTGRHKVKLAKGQQEKTPRKGKKLPHPSTSATVIPSSIPSLDSLPIDPYQRALRLLHVGATPESLPCREEEFVDVLSKVEEGVESGGGGCLYIAGVPGTGKTATVHAVVKELKRKAEDGELPPFSYVEINGLKIPSPQHAYTVLWEAISGSAGVSTKTALRGLEAHFGRKKGGARGPRGHTFVVLMDELDQLLTTKQDVVYNFFNWPTMRDSQMFVIAVANRMDLPQHLAAKIKSRLGLQTLLFQPYDRQNLIEIVQSRLVAHPKHKGPENHKVLLPDAIALAATKMAGTNGDARRVLDACRRAVEVSMEKKTTTPGQPAPAMGTGPRPVAAKDMMAVLNQMSSSPVAMFIKGCSEQQKMMMAAVVRCVRREGVPEIAWRAVRSDHDNLTRSLLETNDLLSPSELAIVLTSLLASHALTAAMDARVGQDDRKVALGMEIGEVGRILMNEGESWRRALAGT